MSGDAYSRLILFLKVALPLVALAILSTLFLLSARIDPADSIPFAEGEVVERIRGQQVTGPLFSGVTGGGDMIRFSAEELITIENGRTEARNPAASLELARGGGMSLVADRGLVALADDSLVLTGDVLVSSTNGYRMRSDEVVARLSELNVVSPGEVAATGPAGTLTAGRMQISQDANNVQILFTNGVHLIYDPNEPE